MCVSVSDFHQHWFSKLKGNKYIKKEIPKTISVDAGEIVQQLRTSATAPNDPYLIFNTPPIFLWWFITSCNSSYSGIHTCGFTHTHTLTHISTHRHIWAHTWAQMYTYTDTNTYTYTTHTTEDNKNKFLKVSSIRI